MLPRWGMCRVQTGCLVFVSMLLSLMVLWVRWGTLGLVSVWSAVLFCCILGGYFQLAWPVSMTTHPRDHNHDQDQAKKKNWLPWLWAKTFPCSLAFILISFAASCSLSYHVLHCCHDYLLPRNAGSHHLMFVLFVVLFIGILLQRPLC